MKTAELETPQAQFTPQQIAEFFRSEEGQQILRQSRLPQTHKPRAPMSEAEMEKYCKMAEKTDIQYIRIDPATKKPLAEEEPTFWRIINATPEVVGNHEGQLRVSFYLIRYYKNKTYKRAISPSNSDEVTEHEPFTIRKTSRWSKMYELTEVGDRIIDAADFMEQYKRDEE